MGDPVTLVAVALGAQAGMTGLGISAGRRQDKMQEAQNKVETAAAKEATAAESLKAAKNFRAALSSQLAASALRSQGGGSIASQFAAGSIANMFADEREFAKRQKLLDLSSSFASSNIRTAAFARNVAAGSNLISTIGSAAAAGSSKPPETSG